MQASSLEVKRHRRLVALRESAEGTWKEVDEPEAQTRASVLSRRGGAGSLPRHEIEHSSSAMRSSGECRDRRSIERESAPPRVDPARV